MNKSLLTTFQNPYYVVLLIFFLMSNYLCFSQESAVTVDSSGNFCSTLVLKLEDFAKNNPPDEVVQWSDSIINVVYAKYNRLDTNFAQFLINLTYYQILAGNHEKAFTNLTKSKIIIDSLIPQNTKIQSDYYKFLTAVHIAKRNYSTAGKYFNQYADNYFTTVDSLVFANTLSKFGSIFLKLDRFYDTEFVLRSSNKYAKARFGDKNYYYAWNYSLLAELYRDIGRYDEAIEIYKYFLEVSDGYIKKYDPCALYTPLADLTTCYILKHDFEQALKYNEKSWDVFVKSKPQDELEGFYTEFQHVFTKFAIIYIGLGRMAEADKYLRKAVKCSDTIIKNAETQHFFIQTNMSEYFCNLHSKLYYQQGCYLLDEDKLAEADSSFQKAMKFAEIAYPKNHRYYARNLLKLSALYQTQGQFNKSDSLLNILINIDFNTVKTGFANLPEQERQSFYENIKNDFEYYYSSLASDRIQNEPKLVEKLFDFRLATKSILLNSSKKNRTKMNKSENEGITTYQRWLELKDSISILTIANTMSKNKDTLRLQDLLIRTKDLEIDLAAKSDAFSNETDRNWKEVQESLSDDEAAIEIVRFRKYDKVPNK